MQQTFHLYHLEDNPVLFTAARPEHDSAIRGDVIHRLQLLCYVKIVEEKITTHRLGRDLEHSLACL